MQDLSSQDKSLVSSSGQSIPKTRSKQELIEVFLKLQQGIQLYSEQNNDCKNQIQQQIDTNKQIEESNKAQLLHFETVNMMTKYQIVFLKLETAMFNIIENSNVRRVLRLKKAFLKFRQNKDSYKVVSNQRKKLAVLKFESNLSQMCSALNRYRLKQLGVKGFVKWHLQVKLQSQNEKLNQDAKLNQQKLNLELEKVMKRLEDASMQIKQNNQQIQIAQSQLEKHQAELASKEKNMSKKQVINAASTSNRQTQQSNQQSNAKKQKVLDDLKRENTAMKRKLDQASSGIGDYISEMSTLLDSAELNAALNMDMCDSEDEQANIEAEVEYDEPFEDAETRPHAGTGGSSKLRSRPDLRNRIQNNVNANANQQSQAR